MIRAAVGFPSRSCFCPPEAAATQEAPVEDSPLPVPRDWQGCSEQPVPPQRSRLWGTRTPRADLPKWQGSLTKEGPLYAGL